MILIPNEQIIFILHVNQVYLIAYSQSGPNVPNLVRAGQVSRAGPVWNPEGRRKLHQNETGCRHLMDYGCERKRRRLERTVLTLLLSPRVEVKIRPSRVFMQITHTTAHVNF